MSFYYEIFRLKPSTLLQTKTPLRIFFYKFGEILQQHFTEHIQAGVHQLVIITPICNKSAPFCNSSLDF